ncbi:MAG: glycosyltransferase family 4 protein [bacterium]|nr:glycosyltransferase family 4 protein [bacterium]
MKRKNVLIVTGNTKPNSGMGRYSLSIIEQLRGLGVDYKVLNVLYRKFSIINLIKKCFLVRKELEKYDNIHAFDCWPYGVYAYLGVLGTRKKLFINGVGTYSVPSGNLLKMFLMINAYKRAEKIFCISNYTKDRILERIPYVKAEVVFLGTTKLPEVSHKQQEGYRRKYNFTSRYPILLTVGAIKERKGQFETIQALYKLKNKYPDALYLMVGSNSDRNYVTQIEKYAKEFGMENNIKILSDVHSDTELAYLYSLCHVFLLNSNNVGTHFEGFGLVLLEAGQLGKPVIGSKGCGIEDVIQNGYNGYLTEQRNPEDIYEKLVSVLGGQYETFAKNSIEFSKKFTWSGTVSSYIRHY